MDEDYTPWDDGAAELLTVPLLTGTQQMLMRGPLVITGWSLSNSGAGSVKVTLFDGNAQIGPASQINAGSTNNLALPDRGIKIHTELQILVGAGGNASGCIFVRYPPNKIGRQEE